MLSDPSAASEAFEEFYNRFKGFVLHVCRKACMTFDNSNQLSDDIFQQTFLKVMYKGYRFRLKTIGKETYTAEIKGWLSKIAKNELIDFLRKNPDEKSLSNPNRIRSNELEIVSFDPEPGEQEESQKPTLQQHILDKALTILTEDERLVLMTYMLYYNAQAPNNHLPDEVIKSLTVKLGVKAGSLRQIKSRALQKMMKVKAQFSITN